MSNSIIFYVKFNVDYLLIDKCIKYSFDKTKHVILMCQGKKYLLKL